jgi:hypothetical protein
LIFGHSTLGTLLVARPGLEEAMLESALQFLLRTTTVRGLRILVPPGGFELRVMERLAVGRPLQFSYREDSHHVVSFSDGYDAFLQALSVKARRNMRYYRRRYEAGGHRYIEQMDPAEFRRVAYQLLHRSVIGGSREGVDRALSMFCEADRPLLAGLRRRDGEWRDLGGWHQGDSPVVFFQMNNDHDFRADSLSVVLRAYFIETLVNRGYQRAYFWAGVSGPVARGASAYPSYTAHLDWDAPHWRAVQNLCKRLAHLPRKARSAVAWISPDFDDPCPKDVPEPA